MRIRVVFFAVFVSTATLAHAAGLKFIQIPSDADGPAIDAAMWSPCAQAAVEARIPPFTRLNLHVTPNCPIMGEKLPLIVISHGYGGSMLGHRDTAQALADGGFIVVAINHPHANSADMSQANGMGVLIERPLDIKRTIDFMLGASPDATKIDPRSVGFYGFSQGGYTGLVVAGANPDFSMLPPRCADPKTSDCPPKEVARPHARLNPPPSSWTHDSRVKAMVVADPLSVVFLSAESVKGVKIPLQLWGSQFGGGRDATPEQVATLARLLPEKPDFRIVPNSVHLSFLTPCPDGSPSSDACTDAPGFDRAAFHQAFNGQVLSFFRTHLLQASAPN